jgi:hypothetical protein
MKCFDTLVQKMKNYLFPAEKERTVLFSSKERGYLFKKGKKKIETNWIATTKYRWWNFIFLNLFEQFYYRNANIYFLFVALLTLIPNLRFDTFHLKKVLLGLLDFLLELSL